MQTFTGSISTANAGYKTPRFLSASGSIILVDLNGSAVIPQTGWGGGPNVVRASARLLTGAWRHALTPLLPLQCRRIPADFPALPETRLAFPPLIQRGSPASPPFPPASSAGGALPPSSLPRPAPSSPPHTAPAAARRAAQALCTAARSALHCFCSAQLLQCAAQRLTFLLALPPPQALGPQTPASGAGNVVWGVHTTPSTRDATANPAAVAAAQISWCVGDSTLNP